MSCVRQLGLVIGVSVSVATVLTGASPRGSGDNPKETFAALERWLDAVDAHQPGQRDAAAERIGGLKNKDLDAITPYIETLIDLLPAPGNRSAAVRRGMDETAVEPIRQLARTHAARGDVNRIMKRAAMLHADVMMSGAWKQERLSTREALREARSGGMVAVLGVDGEHEGFAVIPRHWALARLLLDGVHPDPAADDFVRLWYRATTAYMLQRAQWGDTERHLRHARERLTPDAHTHLDSGCLYEAYANPRAQAMMRSAQGRGVRFDVRPAAENLRLADMHFTQATVLDPTLTEARVRRARARILLGRAEEAVPDLEAMSIAATDPVVRYYAVLFLGQAQETLERFDAARAAYQRAATLYPMSQAPHLALSLLAREAGERQAAHFALGNFLLSPTADRIRYDPWWVYFWGSGRNMRALVLRVWAESPGAATS